MPRLELNQADYPKLSTWNPEHLDKTLSELVMKANPNKTEITEADKMWAAQMLEMDLQAQNGTISESENQQEEPLTQENRKMLNKNIPWGESYSGELRPPQEDTIDDFPK
jgi:hypothetical protein